MIRLNVYLAANAVIYLPIYVAHEKGLFKTLYQKLALEKGYDVEVQLCVVDGDQDAINQMIADDRAADESLYAIAIADPNGAVNCSNAVVIASLIDRLSFWGVSSRNVLLRNYGDELREDFDNLVHYNSKLITGYNIGSKIRDFIDKRKLPPFLNVEQVSIVGDEFKDLANNSTFIVTTDLLNIARLQIDPATRIFINYHFAKSDTFLSSEYVTTAIITARNLIECEQSMDILSLFIESIQKAISIIYSAKPIAKEILIGMKCITDLKYSDSDNKQIADRILDIIYDDRIYPFELSVPEDLWRNTIAHNGIEHKNVVTDHIVLVSEKKIAQQFGITPFETFKEDIEPILTRLSNAEKAIEEFKNRKSVYVRFRSYLVTNSWLLLSGFLWVLIVMMAVVVHFWKELNYLTNAVYTFMSLITPWFFTEIYRFWKRKNDKNR